VPLGQDEEEDDEDQQAMVRVLIHLKEWQTRVRTGSVTSEEMEPLPALVKSATSEKVDTVGQQVLYRNVDLSI